MCLTVNDKSMVTLGISVTGTLEGNHPSPNRCGTTPVRFTAQTNQRPHSFSLRYRKELICAATSEGPTGYNVAAVSVPAKGCGNMKWCQQPDGNGIR